MAEVILENVYKRFGNVTAVEDFSLHIKDEEEIWQSGTMDFEPIFKAAYDQGMKGYYVEVERYNYEPIKSVAMSYEYLDNSTYVK